MPSHDKTYISFMSIPYCAFCIELTAVSFTFCAAQFRISITVHSSSLSVFYINKTTDCFIWLE